jgi:hypothetical protein
MRAVDDALLALLEATGIDVNDVFVDADNSGNTVEYPLPYLIYTSSIGSDTHAPRLSGDYGLRSVFFSIMYVGEDRNQAKWAGEKVRAALRRARLSGTGIRKSGLIHLDESQRVRRDDDAIREDGTPLFYGVDLYSVTVTPEEFFS